MSNNGFMIRQRKIPPPHERFLANAILLCEYVGSLAAEFKERGYGDVDPEIVGLVKQFLSISDPGSLIRSFIKHSKKYWTQIDNRDEEFMYEHSMIIFKELPREHVENFRKIFKMRDSSGKSLLMEEDKNGIWKYFDSFVKISKNYEKMYGTIDAGGN